MSFDNRMYIALNTVGERDWTRTTDIELDIIIAHEVSHLFGTEDNNTRGRLSNAYALQFLLYPDQTRDTKLKLNKEWQEITGQRRLEDGTIYNPRAAPKSKAWSVNDFLLFHPTSCFR